MLLRALHLAVAVVLSGGLLGLGTVDPDTEAPAGAVQPGESRSSSNAGSPAGPSAAHPNGAEPKPGHTGSTASPTTSPGPTTVTPPRTQPRLNGPVRDPNSTMEMTASVDPACAKQLQSVVVTVTTRPFSAVAAAVSYADGDGHGTYTLSSADPTGLWTWRFVVPEKAPDGHGEVMIAAQDRSGPANSQETSTGAAAGARLPFEVSDACS